MMNTSYDTAVPFRDRKIEVFSALYRRRLVLHQLRGFALGGKGYDRGQGEDPNSPCTLREW